MEKTIKYLENGEYHYATVKDVGDLAKLKTDSKDDLVTAINELFITGGEGPKKPDGYDELVDNVADAIQKQQQMTDTITNMQQSAQLSDAEMEHMKQVQEELHQEYLKAIKELNEAVDKAKADAAALEKKTNDMQDKIDETFADVNKEVSDVHKQLEAEAKGLHKDLDETKTNLEATRKDLLNSTQEYGQVHSDVQELQDKFNRRVWSTDLDPVREQVSKNSTEVQQTKDELKNKADQSNLDLVTNSVENLSAQVKQNASGLEVAVKRDELGGDVSRLLNDKTNLLLGTRSFSGEDNWKNRDTVTIEPGYYKGLKSAAVQVFDGSIYQPYRVKADTAYTFSFFARENKDNPKAKLAIKPIDAKNINIDNEEQVVHITTEWQRFAVTFSVDKECDISIQVIQGPETTNNVLHLAGLKLQYGQNDTPWEPNEADVAENIEHTESQFNVYSDQITGIVKKQEKMGDTERQLDTRITETAEGLKQTSKDLQNANGKITEFKGQLESTAKGLKTEYEKYTNEAIGQISDSSLNLIHNSAFSNQDDQFESWQNISAKATVREDSNNLHWVELTQSGQGTDNPIGVTSNYFIVKQGKVTVAVDVKLGDKANLDNQNILLLELYDENKKRVDFTDVSVSQLGLSMSILNDHNVHRGLYRLGIDRKDVKYMTVKAILHRNGDLWFTNFSAKLSSIDDGAYVPNPEDLNQQILKMNTKIEEDAEHIALKANSVDVTRDIKSAVDGVQIGGVNLVKNTSKEFTMGYGIPNTTWKDNSAFLALPTKINNSEILPQEPHIFWYSLTPGATYTQTIWVETDATPSDFSRISITWFADGLDHDFQPARIVKLANNQYKIIGTYTWPGKASNKLRLFDIISLDQAFNLAGSGTYLKFTKLKLEKGNQSTDYSTAPEDVSDQIKSAKDAAIQVASDQINIKTNELTTKYNESLNQRINESKSASEKFTSDQIVQTVKKITDVQGNVDKLDQLVKSNNGGGINLLKGTANFRPDDIWFPLGAWTRTSEKYNGLTVFKVHVDESWNGLTQYYPVKSGETYTFSLNARYESGNGKSSFYIELNDPQQEAGHNHAHVSPSSQSVLLTEDWNRYSITFTVNSDGYIKPRIERDNFNKNILEICGFKLEKGSVATPWTPAPEDAESTYSTLREEIKSSKEAAIKVASDNVQIKVDELSTTLNDSFNQKINEAKEASQKFTSDGIEQTVRKITDVQNNVNNLNEKVDSNNGGGINLQKGTKDCSFQIGTNGNPSSIETYNSDTKMIHTQNGGFYTSYSDSSFVPTPGEFYTISADMKGDGAINGSGFRYEGGNNGTMDNVTLNDTWQRIINTVHVDRVQGQWVIYPSSSKNLYVKHIKIERGTIATPWTPAPEDIDQTIKDVAEYKTVIGTIDFNNLKTQQKIFYKDSQATNAPAGGNYWYYLDVEPGYDGRILQTAISDRDNITWVRTFADSWTPWIRQADKRNVDYLNDQINSFKNETTAKITNLGDRVTTEVNSVTTKINDSHTNDVELIRNNNFPDGNKGSWNGNLTTVIDGNNIPAELGQNGMKVLRVIQRDTYEDDIWYSVKPSEIFDVDYWIWPTGSYDSQLGLYFVDKDKGNSTWRGVVAKKGTGWTHYTGTIEAPSNAAFAKPWIQVDKDASETGSAAWIGKPSIRRHDSFAEQKISEINTKLDVANGKIEGKVTETQVNDILNGKGYATQSWAESNFRMKSDSIELEVRKITDPISDKINGVNNRLNSFQVGGRNYLRNSDKTITGWGQDLGTIPNETLNELAGKTITVSCDVEWSGYAHDNSQQNRLGFEMYAKGSDGHDYWIGSWVHPSTDSGKERVSAQYTLPAGVTFTVGNNGHNGYIGINGSGKVSHVKIEIGNRMTDWTPAPEDINEKINTQTLDSANIDNMRTQGHYFVRNLTGNPIPGWVYVDVTGNNNDRIRQDVYGDQSYVHKFRSWNGSRWTDWEEEVKNTDIISKINISPENIKLSSSKIEIDGNTYIHGDLQTKNVRLVGKKGVMDLSGDSGLVLQNNNGSIISLGESGLDLKYKNDFEINIDSQVMTLSRRNGVLGQEMPIAFGNIGSVMLNKDTKSNGFMLRYNPGSPTDPKLAGASFMAFGYNTTTPGEIQSQMIMYAKDTQITGTRVQRKGIHFLDAIEFDGNLPIRFPSAHDNLYIHSRKWDSSQQAGYYQPSISLQSNDGNYGNAGVTFQWDAIKPFGAVDMTNASIWMQDAEKELRFNWIANDSVFGGAKLPALYRPNDDGSIASGIAFAPGSTWDFSSGVHNITAGMLRLGV